MGNELVIAALLKLVDYSFSHSVKELLQKTVDEAEEIAGSSIGFCNCEDPETQELSLQAWSTRTTTMFCSAEQSGRHYPVFDAGVWSDCIHERRPVIHNDYNALPHRKGMPRGHAVVTRELVVPVFRNGRMVAILGVGNKATDYDQRDVENVTLLADMAWGVAERKILDEILLVTEERYRTMAEVQMGFVARYLPGGVLTYVSEPLARCVGSNPRSLLGTSFFLFLNEADRDEVAMQVGSISLEKPSCEYESHLPLPDGRSRCIHWSLAGIFNLQGALLEYQAVGRETLTGRDAAGPIWTEPYREMSRQVLEVLNNPGGLHELIHRVLSILKTQTGFDAVGVRLQEGDDYPYVVQDGFPRDFLRAENSLLRRSVDGGLCRDEEGNVCLECACGLVVSGCGDPGNPYFTPGGSCWTNDFFPLLYSHAAIDPRLNLRNECMHQGYASVALVPIRDGGKIVGLIQFNDRQKDRFTPDIVERLEEIASYVGVVFMRKRMEEEKLALQQQVQQTQKLESLGVLAGGIAHDFNNILSVIVGYSSLAKHGNAASRAIIAEIEKAAGRAADLCRQMLAYAGKMQFVEERVEVGHLVADTVRQVMVGLTDQAALRYICGPDIPSIRADAAQIGQVATNLLLNAAEAIGEGPGKIRVSLSRRLVGNQLAERDYFGNPVPPGIYACLEVGDDGCGMDTETCRRIFEPFFTTKFTGRGLGLSAVLGIVRSHGGFLQLHSTPGEGTRFIVSFPAA